MRVLHVVQGYSPAIGGTERLIQKVSEKLVERHGDDVTVFTTTAYNCELFWRRDQPQLPAGIETIDGVSIRRFPVFNRLNGLRRVMAGAGYRLRLPFNDWLRAAYNGPLVPGMTAAIAQSGADVVAASSFPLLHMHYALWGGRRAGIPVVYYGGIHTADPFGFDRPMIYRAIRRAHGYIANTAFEKGYLVERGIPAELVSVAGVGIDVAPFANADGRPLRDRFGWGDAPVVAFIGQQVPHKGLDMLLDAMKRIWVETPDACLLIAGAQTTYSAFVKQWIENLPPELRSRAAVIDNFDEAEKPAIFTACDMLVSPSAHESFGIVFLEAWAACKPVIGARVGAISDVIDEGRDGLLIEHRNTSELIGAIRKLISRPELGCQLGDQGHTKVLRRFTWDIVADRYRDAYVTARARHKQRP